MISWYNSSDVNEKSKFVDLYANLLLSNESDNPERAWVNEPLYKPIIEFLKSYIPLKDNSVKLFRLAQNNDKIRIKDTQLPIDSENWLVGQITWFYWDSSEIEISEAAISKMSIQKFDLINLLQIKDIESKINQWLKRTNYSYSRIILEELNELFKNNKNLNETFWNNLELLKIWEFEDGYFSIKDLGNYEEYSIRLLLFETLDSIKDQLVKGGWKLSKQSLLEFPNLAPIIQTRYQNIIKYIRNYEELIKVLNLKLPYAELSKSEKLCIVSVLAKKLKDDKEERISKIRELTLFRNSFNKVMPLKSLINSSNINWLLPWNINPEEYDSTLDDYLISDNMHIYQNIIYLYWNDIVLSLSSDKDIRSLFDFTKGLYNSNNTLEVLSNKKIIKIGKAFVDQNSDYYCTSSLKPFSKIEYLVLESAFAKLELPPLPDFDLLDFYYNNPFKIEQKYFNLSLLKSVCLSYEEVRTFLSLCVRDNSGIFKKILIIAKEKSEFVLIQRPDNVMTVFTENKLIVDYIIQFHKDTLAILPLAFEEFENSVDFSGASLIKKLIDLCNLEDGNQLSILADIVLQAESEVKKYLLQKLPNITFNLNKELTAELASVKLLKLLLGIDDESFTQKVLKLKSIILYEKESLKLSEINLLGNDEVLIQHKSEKTSLSLSLILLDADTKSTMIISKLTENLTSLGIADKNRLDSMFGLMGRVENAVIAKQLISLDENYIIDNAHQLAFVLLYASQHPLWLSSKTFLVETKTSALPIKDAVLYAPETDEKYIPDSLVLNPRYKGITELLVKNSNIFKGQNNTIICSTPFIENSKVILPGISEIKESENQLYFVKFLFNQWKLIKTDIQFLSLSDSKYWIDLIGFDPPLAISGSDLIIHSEVLPHFIQEWLCLNESILEEEEKLLFLKTLGVNFPDSNIINLRKYLLGEENEVPNERFQLPEKLVINTLILLEQRKAVFVIDNQRYSSLKDLYKRLNDSKIDVNIPLPVISELHPDSVVISTVNNAAILKSEIYKRLKDINYHFHQLPKDAGKQIIYAPVFVNATSLYNKLNDLSIEFDILDTETIYDLAKEWDGNFYIEWKRLNPCYKVFCFPGNIPYTLKISGNIVFSYYKNEIAKINTKIIVNNEKNDKSIIALIEKEKFLPEESILKLKELFNVYDNSIQDFLNRIYSDENLKIEFEKLRQKERIEQKKRELADDFSSSEKYSRSWFLNLLELMEMSGSKNLTNPEDDIIFNEIIYNLKDLRLLILRNPSKPISPSIEQFTDFKATFSFLDESGVKRNKMIKISGISKKGHDVIAMPANVKDLESIELATIKEVELSFVRSLDLIKKLNNAFKELNIDVNLNLKSVLTENIKFIFGPPGTGKTTEISKQVVNKISSGDSNKILILTPTNNAADVLAKRILSLSNEDLCPESWLTRFGSTSDYDLLERGIVSDKDSYVFSEKGNCVFITTIHRFPYEIVNTLNDEIINISDIEWDTIIFDEASMIMLPAIILPLFKRKYKQCIEDESKYTEFIIGGDPLQLPPIYDITDSDLGEDNEGIKEENIYSMIGLSSFDEKIQSQIPKYGDKIINLPVQYRSIEPIGSIFSKFQYNGILKHGRNDSLGGSPEPRSLPQYFTNLGFRSITIIRYPVNSSDVIFDPQKLNDSPFHLYSSFLLNELILKLRSEVRENWDVGVIAPYRSQANLLNKLIESHLDKTKLTLITDTVHGFQGGECDIIFALFNPSSINASFSRFLKKEYIINVAVSRAKDYLILLLPDEKTTGFNSLTLFHESFPNSLLSIIKELPQDTVSYLDAVDLEKKIMGKENYFQKNSFTNLHQSVNIYSDLYKDYIVKLSKSAIDVHLKMK